MQFVIVLACIAVASAIELQYNPEYNGGYSNGYAINSGYNGGYSNGYSNNNQDKYYDAPAQYDFAYGVKDLKTGDIKEQQESRQGDVVKGRYSLVDSDGYERIVEYSADGKSGFNAVVQRVPLKGAGAYPLVQKVVAAPILSKIAIQSPNVYYGGASADQGYYTNKGQGASSYSTLNVANSANQYNQYKY